MSETKPQKKPSLELYSILDSNDLQKLALELSEFIRQNRLYQDLQGKQYVNVEGWQYAGQRLGIAPIGEYCRRLERPDGEIAYEAATRLVDLRLDKTVGQGAALCSNRESGKKNNPEYAIMSMAQTRAIGKAYRLLLAYLIRAAGFEPTPAEEMDSIAGAQKSAAPAPAASAPAAGSSAPAKATGTPAGQGGPAIEQPPGINPNASKWFDDEFKENGVFDLDKVVRQIEENLDLDAARGILSTFRMKKPHRVAIESVFRLVAGKLAAGEITNKPKQEAKPAEAAELADNRPTKTDAEFRSILEEAKKYLDAVTVKKTLDAYAMRPAVRAAFDKALADIDDQFRTMLKSVKENIDAATCRRILDGYALRPAVRKAFETALAEIEAAPAKAPAAATKKAAPAPAETPDDLDQEPPITERQKEILVELGNWPGYDRKARVANLTSLGRLTALEAEARIEDFSNYIKKQTGGAAFVADILQN